MRDPLFYISCIIFLANALYSVNKTSSLDDAMNDVFDQYIQKYGSKNKKEFQRLATYWSWYYSWNHYSFNRPL